ncbi:hypothetical protein ACFL04_01635 [Patescibacteria group bacterium]
MLEQLFSSRTRVKLLRLFLNNPEQSYYTRELTRSIGGHIHSVRRELNNLIQVGLLISEGAGTKKYYKIDSKFPILKELKDLFFKAQLFHERSALQKLSKLKGLQALILTGFFTSQTHTLTDLLIVGTVNKGRVKRMISAVQKDVDHEISYTTMSKAEFQYRHNLTDRFLIAILDHPNIILLNKFGLKL